MSADLGTTPRDIQRFLARYRASGLRGLRIQWAPGHTPLILEGLAPTILGCKDGLSKMKRMQVAFAHHLLDVARAYPRHRVAASRPRRESVHDD
ncbi:hypothetical protein [Corallococcus silvisoli]|uniref:hypothetical protein n=1 Tax=Corallococcus silvisoli TaxID=2697031 RepID=UPI001376AC86|nr:hypothetical protein [Corallococcus silvisoli]NBD11311.1 hypothetical protein [Corallococcus silvisoli]